MLKDPDGDATQEQRREILNNNLSTISKETKSNFPTYKGKIKILNTQCDETKTQRGKESRQAGTSADNETIAHGMVTTQEETQREQQ